jgi:hypothetical protein
VRGGAHRHGSSHRIHTWNHWEYTSTEGSTGVFNSVTGIICSFGVTNQAQTDATHECIDGVNGRVLSAHLVPLAKPN